jgi:hypothetical protein
MPPEIPSLGKRTVYFFQSLENCGHVFSNGWKISTAPMRLA